MQGPDGHATPQKQQYMRPLLLGMYQGSVDLAQTTKYLEGTGMDWAPVSRMFSSIFFGRCVYMEVH
jgi:hypothetical protein